MSIEYSQQQSNIRQRKQVLLNAAKVFTDRGTPLMVLKPQSLTSMNEKHLFSQDQVEAALASTPSCNLAAIIEKNHDLLAIKFERESDYDPDPMELLENLESIHGKLTSTMTIEYPNNVQYRLYAYPSVGEIRRTNLDKGIRVIKNNISGTGIVLLENSELNGAVVKESSHRDVIANLPDSWINFICSDPYEEFVASPSPVAVQRQLLLEVESENLPAQVATELQELTDTRLECIRENIDDSASSGSQDVSPEEFLMLKVAQMSKSGDHPSQIMLAVMNICQRMEMGLTYDEAFLLVYNVLCGLSCYEKLQEDERLLRFIADVELIVFKDHHKEICCKISTTGEVVLLSTKNESKISKHLNYRMMRLTNQLPKETFVKSVIKGLDVIGHFESPEVKMFNRIGKHDGQIYYDLGNENAVCINADGWEIVPCPPIFRRYPNHKVQVTPVTGGSLDRFFEFVNYEETDKLLLMVYMVSGLIPDIAHPLLYVYGAHGSAKSSLSSKIKSVIDPSATEKLSLSKKTQEVTRNLKHYYASLYDNISYVPGDISDLFCMASTGGGVDNRKLYTDEDSNIMSFKHCVILNGITIAIRKPDLLDRTILIKLKRIDDDKRKSDEDINPAFEQALPEILGGAFDILSKATGLYPNVKVTSLPRMADFAKWGYAIAEAIGGYGEQFIKDYKANIAEQNAHVAAGDSLCNAVLLLMENKSSLPLTIGKAYEELKKLARTDSQDKTFPRRDKDLRPALEKIGPVLDSFGIQYEFGTIRGAHGYTVKFTNSAVKVEPSVEVIQS